jgi:O-antigen ligase
MTEAARRAAVGAGYLALLATLCAVLFLKESWLPHGLAGAATVLLALDRRLGPLAAALMVLLAVPWGRGAEVGLPEIGGAPIRPHDVVAILGSLLILPRAVSGAVCRTAVLIGPSMVPFLVFLGVGLMALLVGVAADNSLRDVVRDLRWWGLYAVGALAILAGTRRAALVRALLWGLTLYSAIVLLAMLMPVVEGAGLKWYAYLYDPRMRLHYGQAVLLLVAVGFVSVEAVRRPRAGLLALAALFAAAISITLTRTLLAGLVGLVLIVVAWRLAEIARRRRAEHGNPWALGRRALPLVVAIALGIAAGFGTYEAGVRIWRAADDNDASGAPAHRPVLPSSDRVLGGRAGTDLEAQAGGRLLSYGLAFDDVARSPLIGHGMGQPARVPWAWGGHRASTLGVQPGVDDAYLTVGLKAGLIGIVAFAGLMLWPLRAVLGDRRRRLWTWYAPAWLIVCGLTLIQSFAVSGYAPFALSLLIALPFLGARAVDSRS